MINTKGRVSFTLPWILASNSGHSLGLALLRQAMDHFGILQKQIDCP
jgi:hypothetical protein